MILVSDLLPHGVHGRLTMGQARRLYLPERVANDKKQSTEANTVQVSMS
jgi:hypothetical protein